MESESSKDKGKWYFWFAIAFTLFGISFLCVAGVLLYKYEKAAVYVCYYGVDNSNPFGASISSERPTKGTTWLSNGTWMNTNDIRCERMSEDNFSCPARFDGGDRAYYTYVTEQNIADANSGLGPRFET